MIVVYDYTSNGSLFHQLYGIYSNSPRLSWKKMLEISIGVASGLHYLHSGAKRSIIHGDIAPVNILLDENWIPKLKFFGVSMKEPKFSEKDVKRLELESVKGTWESPNVMHKSDVCSFGVVKLELIFGKTLFRVISEDEVHNL
ncbi:hypothetical protein K1719_004621 [Acacia pycnantha]|nr:hypothetical protein K1719_004621 [Acacia pycnantha]